jgi:hypothetical protein
MDWATCWAIFSQTHLVTLGRNVHVQSKLIKWAKQTVFEARVLTHLHVILLQQKCSEEKILENFPTTWFATYMSRSVPAPLFPTNFTKQFTRKLRTKCRWKSTHLSSRTSYAEPPLILNNQMKEVIYKVGQFNYSAMNQ